MRFTVDPWDPTYGSSLDTELGSSTAVVDESVEVPAARWAPIDPPGTGLAPDAVLFVDGVRRVDAQVWIDDAQESLAVCASYAAGVVCSCAGEGAHLAGGEVRRGLFTTTADPADIVTGAGVYTAEQTPPRPGVAPAQVLSWALQGALARLEDEVADVARARPGAGGSDLLVVDGPLGRRQHLPRTIGFAKSHRSTYLPAELGGIVARLRPGQRTPVFALSAPRDVHSWYLRLPGAPDAPWAGIVRVEAAAAAGSIELAAVSQVTLVRFASTGYKDSRAPQNLYPIAGLERALRRRLGEPGLLYRALRRAAAEMPAPAG